MNGRRLRASIAGALIVLVGVVAAGYLTKQPAASGAAPEVVGRTLGGERFALSGERGRWVLVNFFASWCADCRQELSQLVALDRQRPGGLVVVGVDDDDQLHDAQMLVHRAGGDWPVISDDAATTAFRVVGLPESVLVDQKGSVAWTHLGAVTTAEVRRVITAGGGRTS